MRLQAHSGHARQSSNRQTRPACMYAGESNGGTLREGKEGGEGVPMPFLRMGIDVSM